MSALLAIALGAALGAPARASLERVIGQRYDSGKFPIALSIINIAGSFFAGVVVTTTTGDLRLFLLVGVAGAFTTFSGWVQAISMGYRLRRPRGWRPAITWALLTGIGIMVVCVSAAWVGAAWVGTAIAQIT